MNELGKFRELSVLCWKDVDVLGSASSTWTLSGFVEDEDDVDEVKVGVCCWVVAAEAEACFNCSSNINIFRLKSAAFSAQNKLSSNFVFEISAWFTILSSFYTLKNSWKITLNALLRCCKKRFKFWERRSSSFERWSSFKTSMILFIPVENDEVSALNKINESNGWITETIRQHQSFLYLFSWSFVKDLRDLQSRALTLEMVSNFGNCWSKIED